MAGKEDHTENFYNWVQFKNSWPCAELFKETISCLQENNQNIGACQQLYSNFEECSLNGILIFPKIYVRKVTSSLIGANEAKPQSLFSRIKNSRFFVDSDTYGREEGALAKGLKTVAGQVFDEEAEKKVSVVTEKLQEKLPNIFVADDDD